MNQNKSEVKISEFSELDIELAHFWQEISKHLPRSIEREALGDEKIFNAIRIAYPKIREHILDQALAKQREETMEIIKGLEQWADEATPQQEQNIKIYNSALSDLKNLLDNN